MDVFTAEKRSQIMRSVKNKDSKIELLLRKVLWNKGIRYRKNYAGLPGKPDLALTKYRIAVFCDSEFWHGYDWENRKKTIHSNREFWFAKIERNIQRDNEVNAQLSALGWKVLRFWGHEISKDVESCISRIRLAIDHVLRNQ